MLENRNVVEAAGKRGTVSLIQTLPSGPLDIVGDIHGEHEALCQLLGHLGYDAEGGHPAGRHLVFVGDFCDRGPDSPAVMALAARLMQAGRAHAVLGNHEINLLRGDAKDGAGWFFEDRFERDRPKYAPYRRSGAAERAWIHAFLSALPVALERPDLRIVHAAWVPEKIDEIRALPAGPGSLIDHYEDWERAAVVRAEKAQLRRRMQEELQAWAHGLEDPQCKPPFLSAHAEFDAVKQTTNPLKVVTSGVERQGTAPFYAGGRWRFSERVAWWDRYAQAIPVVVGHYWRRLAPAHARERASLGKGDSDLFERVDPLAWHGLHGNVFCVDFSVGGRWAERKAGKPLGTDFKLAALQWPERTLCFDDGQRVPTHGFGEPLKA